MTLLYFSLPLGDCVLPSKFSSNSVYEKSGSNSSLTLGAEEGTCPGSYSELVAYVGTVRLDSCSLLFPLLTRFSHEI